MLNDHCKRQFLTLVLIPLPLQMTTLPFFIVYSVHSVP